MILVTGGAGYIGSHVVLNLLEKGETIIIFDDLSKGYIETIDTLKKVGKLIFIRGDLNNYEEISAIFSDYPIEAVFHFAAFIEVGESVKDPEKYYRNNLLGGINLFSAMLKAKVKKIVFSSTAATYGEPKYIPIDESHPQNPVNAYGNSKLMLERILKDYDQAYGLKSIILRYFNVIGADALGRIGENHQPETHLVPNLLKAALFKSPVKLYGDDYPTSDGTCVRDYIDVEDLADAHVLALKYLNEHKKSMAFNLGTKNGNSVKEIIKKIEEIVSDKISIELEQRRMGDPAILVSDNHLVKKELGWEPKRNLLESIKNAKNWLIKNGS